MEKCVAGNDYKKALVGHVAIEVAEFDAGGISSQSGIHCIPHLFSE